MTDRLFWLCGFAIPDSPTCALGPLLALPRWRSSPLNYPLHTRGRPHCACPASPTGTRACRPLSARPGYPLPVRLARTPRSALTAWLRLATSSGPSVCRLVRRHLPPDDAPLVTEIRPSRLHAASTARTPCLRPCRTAQTFPSAILDMCCRGGTPSAHRLTLGPRPTHQGFPVPKTEPPIPRSSGLSSIRHHCPRPPLAFGAGPDPGPPWRASSYFPLRLAHAHRHSPSRSHAHVPHVSLSHRPLSRICRPHRRFPSVRQPLLDECPLLCDPRTPPHVVHTRMTLLHGISASTLESSCGLPVLGPASCRTPAVSPVQRRHRGQPLPPRTSTAKPHSP